MKSKEINRLLEAYDSYCVKEYIPIVIMGPTASGKTSLAHELFHQFERRSVSCHTINLDAFQIYRQLNIGTAKASADELQRYCYHGVDLYNVDENSDANQFSSDMRKIAEDLLKQKKIPICVGGSGLYLRSFLHGLDLLPPRNEEVRNQIKAWAAEHGWGWCYEKLTKEDPERAKSLHPNDSVRIERALEILILTGKKMSDFLTKANPLHEQDLLFPCFIVHVEMNKERLRENINKRVAKLLGQGWLDEVDKLYKIYGNELQKFHSMRAIGYNNVLRFLMDKSSLDNLKDLEESISNATWVYAKRQLTWNAQERKDFVLDATHWD